MKLLRRAVAIACAVAAVIVMAPGANAAVSYWYRPSHPMNHSPQSLPETDCTGAWGVRTNGTSAPYFLTAGHCFSTNQPVYGTSGQFGVGQSSHWSFGGVDSALIRPLPGVDGLQEIPDLGRVVGKMSNEWSTTAGNGIAMQSPRTGRVYGTIAGGWWLWYNDTRVACGTYWSVDGDSGSPVFVHNANGVYAAGVHVGRSGHWACFVTIDDLLADWGVWLPVFSAAAAKTGSKIPDLKLLADLRGPAEKLPVQPLGERVLQ